MGGITSSDPSTSGALGRAEILLQAGRDLSASLNPSVLFATFVEIVRSVTPCDGMVISSFSPEDDSIQCLFACSGGDPIDPSVFPALKLHRSGTGMQSLVILDQKAQMFNVPSKVQEQAPGSYSELKDGGLKPIQSDPPATQAAMMVPMILAGQTTGVVQVMCNTPDAYSDEDLTLLSDLVLQLSPFVHNSLLYTRLQDELRDRRLAEEEVKRSEERFRQLLESMPLIAWTSNPSGESDYINSFYHSYTGVDRSIPPHEGWAHVVHVDDVAEGRALVERCFSEGMAWEQEIRLRRVDGEYRWHLSRMIPMHREDGTIVRWLGTSTEIHSQKETEAELEARVAERTAELESAIRELEGFTYSVSHDLRSPLRSIVANCSMLIQDYGEQLPEAAQEMLERQANAARRMALLMDELLRLSRVGRQEMNWMEVDLTEIACEAVEQIESEGRSNANKFEVEPDLTAHGDPNMLRLVLVNLLENASKFSPDGGVIRVSRDGDTFCVSDQGVGLDMTYADRLFRPFERLVRDDQFEGTGIGLANVKRIIERHHGEVWISSEVGVGSKVFFTLPASLSLE